MIEELYLLGGSPEGKLLSGRRRGLDSTEVSDGSDGEVGIGLETEFEVSEDVVFQEVWNWVLS